LNNIKRRKEQEVTKMIKLLFSFVSTLMQLRNPTDGTDVSLVTRSSRDGLTLL